MLQSKVMLVTGGSRGIGRSIAEHLGATGARVVVNYASSRGAAEEVVAAVRASGGEALAVQGDVAVATDRERLIAETLSSFGAIDVLVNNAGVGPRVRADILEATEESYDFVMGTNLKGPYFLTQAVARSMVSSGSADDRLARGCCIINIGSISAYTASVNRGDYCLSKAGMGMMTALFADRLAEEGVRVYEVRPGVIATDMTGSDAVKRKYDKLILEDRPGLTPVRRWGEGADVARAVVALASGAFAFSTGEVVNVDGGFHMRRL